VTEAELPLAMPKGHVPSYYHPHASPRRDSHVNVPRRKLLSLVRFGFERCKAPLPERPREGPLMVVVSPNSQHTVLVRGGSVDIFDSAGACSSRSRENYGNTDISRWSVLTADVVATTDELFIDGVPFSWTLEVHKDQPGAKSGFVLARDYTKYDFVVVYDTPGHATHRQSSPPFAGVESGQRWMTGKHHFYAQAPLHEGSPAISDGRALGAIGADWSAVLVLDGKTVRVYAPEGDAQGVAKLVATRRLPRPVEWLSLADPGIVVLETRKGGTHLTALNRNALFEFSVDVPFSAYQPAISGATGRLYVAGRGLCALDKGKLTWTHDYDENTYASSFDDGSLAVARSNRLELMTPDGNVTQTFETAEPLVTAPAIAADGSVWVASNQAMYVAR
jgi:hypothetical protein